MRIKHSYGKRGCVFMHTEDQYLEFINVKPRYRGKGLAKVFLSHLMKNHYPNMWGIPGSKSGEALLDSLNIPDQPTINTEKE